MSVQWQDGKKVSSSRSNIGKQCVEFEFQNEKEYVLGNIINSHRCMVCRADQVLPGFSSSGMLCCALLLATLQQGQQDR
jgi:hypothetical protein